MSLFNFDRKWILLGLSTVITLFLMELVIRRFWPARLVSDNLGFNCYQNSEYLSYEYIPGCNADMGGGKWARINSIGLRNKEIGNKLGERMLLLGDSFVFGSGVKDEEKLGNWLEKNTGKEIISAGFSNTGPDTAYLYTVKEGLKQSPDMLVLALFPYNDLEDLEMSVWEEKDGLITKVWRQNQAIDKNGHLVDEKKIDTGLSTLLKNLHLWRFLILKLDSVSFRLKLMELKTGILFRSSTAGHDSYRKCLYFGQCVGKRETAKIKADKTLTLFKKLSNDKKIPLLAVTIPVSDQVFNGEPKSTLFDQLLKEKDIPFLNLAEALTASGKTKAELYLPGGHWTPLGNQIAADVIADWIMKLPENQF